MLEEIVIKYMMNLFILQIWKKKMRNSKVKNKNKVNIKPHVLFMQLDMKAKTELTLRKY